MLDSWERIIYFHLQPAILDGMLSLAGVILLLRIFRVRNPSIRFMFFFIPLVRPLLILLEDQARVTRVDFPQAYLALRIPDPFNLVPVNDLVGDNDFSVISGLIVLLTIGAIVAAMAFLVFRWIGFVTFYRRMRRQSSLVRVNWQTEQKVRDLVFDLSQRMHLKRPPDILYSDGNWITPCAIGWRRPALILSPSLAEQLETEELGAVLAHELSHIRKRDGLWHWLSVLLRDIQAFSPFSHLSISRLELEREKKCDLDAVETLRLSPRLLAKCLVKVTKFESNRQSRPLPGFSFGFIKGQNRLLEDRLNYLLDMPAAVESGHRFNNRLLGLTARACLLVPLLLMSVLQVYMCVWLGGYILVIK